uniref:Peptidase S1 domain-containing protein n=1 Tax=Setaria digitata TaxID=48799 RepID=A0A915Q0R3_9BILA
MKGTDPSECGIANVSSGNTQFKIMGGENVAPGEMPWAIALFYRRVYYCTGTLISRKHVITAAHCFKKTMVVKPCNTSFGYYQEESLQKYTVLYGSNCIHRRNENLCKNSPEMKMSRIIRAQYGRFFHAKCLMADFALLELEDLIKDPLTNYICLGYRNIVRREDQIRLIGYGWGAVLSSYGEKQTNNLQLIDFPKTLSRLECLQASRPKDAVCTVENKTASTCQQVLIKDQNVIAKMG